MTLIEFPCIRCRNEGSATLSLLCGACDANVPVPDLAEFLTEWRDAREAIFSAEKPGTEQFARLAAAELALMQFARTLPAKH